MAAFTAVEMPICFSRRRGRPRFVAEPCNGESLETLEPTIPSAEAKERLCLKCRRPFTSTWAGHRLCTLCRMENETIGMPNGIAPPRRRGKETSLDE
jgi:hypothetical protein